MRFLIAAAALVPLALAIPAPQLQAPTPTQQPLTVDLPNPTAGPGPIVKLPEGSYRGETSGGVNSFRGIPFVQPPVGPLRFQLPTTPVASFSGIKNATAYGFTCTQMSATSSQAGGLDNSVLAALATNPMFNDNVIGEAEDCLTLNIAAPAVIKKGELLPVVIWIYGGGFEFGATKIYPGEPIVERSMEIDTPIVFLSMNYRTNLFGFLASQEVMDAGLGNLGLWDQRVAMRWCQDNIHLFGGDKTKVTSESAGGNSIGYHMIANGTSTDGLYRAAVAQSGSQLPTDNFLHGQKYYDQIVGLVGCTGSKLAGGTLACLRTVSYQALKTALGMIPGPFTYQQLQLPFFPRTDGVFIKEAAQKMVTKGEYARVPLWTSDCEDEGTLFSLLTPNMTTDQDFTTYIKSNYLMNATDEEIAQVALHYPQDPVQGSPYNTGQLYNPTPQYKRMASFQGDMYFQEGRRLFVSFAAKTQPVWSYLFSREKFQPQLGAYHGSDLQRYYFLQAGSAAPGGGIDFQGIDYLISFICTMNPNSAQTERDYIHWPQYTLGNGPTDLQMLHFVDPVVGAPGTSAGTPSGIQGLAITLDTFRSDAMAYLVQLFLKYPL
ncbi:hypothetical protein RQP46_010699 [Phenoliferia psychrophenolica]